jgi:hypothetical protein
MGVLFFILSDLAHHFTESVSATHKVEHALAQSTLMFEADFSLIIEN